MTNRDNRRDAAYAEKNFAYFAPLRFIFFGGLTILAGCGILGVGVKYA
jgi:hypothetical protein